MKPVLAFLQTSWFHDPGAARAVFKRHPEKRNELIARFLFAGCLTGRRLAVAFGKMRHQIIWDEASPIFGDRASSVYRADKHHIRARIEDVNPAIILAFGQIAGDAVRNVIATLEFEGSVNWNVIYAPHPAARGNPMPALHKAADDLAALIDPIHKLRQQTRAALQDQW